MQNYLVPTTPEFVDEIAKSIARDRMMEDASDELAESVGINLADNPSMELVVDELFESLWNNNSSVSIREKARYRKDAEAAIRAINLKMLTLTG